MKSVSRMMLFLFTTPALAEWKFSGNVALYFQKIGIETTTVSPSERGGLNTNLNLENKINSRLRFRSDTWMRADFFARDAGENIQFIPKSLYLQYKTKSLTIKVGYQTLQIDGPDLLNPADVIHAKNGIDPIAPETMSSAGLSFSHEKSDVSWEVLYVPRQTPAALPGAHSPWLPRKNRLPIESEDTEITIPDNVEYQYLGAQTVNNALNHNVTMKLQIGEETQLFAGGLYDMVGKSSLYKATLSHRMTPSLSVEAQGQILQGPSKTLIGLYQRHDSYQLKLIWSF